MWRMCRSKRLDCVYTYFVHDGASDRMGQPERWGRREVRCPCRMLLSTQWTICAFESDSLWPHTQSTLSSHEWVAVVVAITRALHLSAPLYLFNLLDNIHFDINLFVVAIVVFVLPLPFAAVLYASPASVFHRSRAHTIADAVVSSSSSLLGEMCPSNKRACILCWYVLVLYVDFRFMRDFFYASSMRTSATIRRKMRQNFVRDNKYGVVEPGWRHSLSGRHMNYTQWLQHSVYVRIIRYNETRCSNILKWARDRCCDVSAWINAWFVAANKCCSARYVCMEMYPLNAGICCFSVFCWAISEPSNTSMAVEFIHTCNIVKFFFVSDSVEKAAIIVAISPIFRIWQL